jgi:rubrerythrin
MDSKLPKAVESLMYQLLETELGGVQIYEKALECVVNDELRKEWQGYLKETREHVKIATGLLEEMGLDADAETPARDLVRRMGQSLLALMAEAKSFGEADTAQLMACEAVVHAETKDHMNWSLLGELAKSMKDDLGKKLLEAQEEVEEQEDEHLYHTKGWCRELWLKAMGLEAVLPPPEEKKDVHSATEAERAKKSVGSRRAKTASRTKSKSRLSRPRR